MNTRPWRSNLDRPHHRLGNPAHLLLWWFLLSPLTGCGSDEPTQVTDSIPPATIQDLTFARLSDRDIRLTWTAPGDDGNLGLASRYSVRCAAAALTPQGWDSAAVLPSAPTPAPAGRRDGFIVTMPNGRWHIGIRTADEIPNWSMISNQVTVFVGDSIPPATVTDLAVTPRTGHSALLSWTAPGDDGTRGQVAEYDLRYSRELITADSWESATREVGLPPPAAHGSPESHEIDGLETGGTYHFALKSVDDAANWSGISNVASTEITDVAAPSAITDLTARSSGETSVDLTWTAPGNDGPDGTAAAYDVRYSSDALDAGSWENATAAEGLPAPRPSGSYESFALRGLDASRTYFIGIRSRDERFNWSPISNITTAAPGTNPLVRLTYSTIPRRGADDPAWSPDGQTIAFSAYWEQGSDNLHPQIYAMAATGGEALQLTHVDAGARAPAWSPDGSKLAFISMREAYPSTLQELSVMVASPDSEPVVLLTAPNGYALDRPSWSPDGMQIVTVMAAGYTSGDPFSSALGLVPSGGGTGSDLIVGWYTIGWPSWSPDGTRILFAGRPTDGDRSMVWVMPAAGGEPTPLTSGQADDITPAWSPDGNRISFASNRTSSFDLWLMSPAGQSLTRLTFDAFRFEYAPAWSPDGRSIAFTMSRNNVPDVWVLSMP